MGAAALVILGMVLGRPFEHRVLIVTQVRMLISVEETLHPAPNQISQIDLLQEIKDQPN